MKIIVTSDWHLDASTGGISRFEDLQAAVREVVQVAIEQEADAFLFLGDAYDPDAGTCVHRCCALMIESAVSLNAHGVPSFWLAGNHDVIEDGTGETILKPVKQTMSCNDRWVIERPAVLPFGKAKDGASVYLVAMPYCASSHPYSPEEFIRQAAADLPRNLVQPPVIVVAAHLNIEGMIPGSETVDMPRGRDIWFPLDACREAWGDRALLLNGHYHKQQVFRGIHIPGNLARLTFGEEDHTPGYITVEV